MIDKGDWIAVGLLAVALVGALNWGVVVTQGEGILQMALQKESNVNLGRGLVAIAGGILFTEAAGVTDVTDIGWSE